MAGPDRVVIAILACSILAWSSFNQANEVTTKDSDVNPSGQDQNKKENVHDQESQLLTYRKLFALKRRQHSDAIRSISNFKDYSKQYNMVQTMINKIFDVLFQAKSTIIDSGYIPEMPFPKDENIRDAISKIYENTAFIGEIALKIPDITHKIFDKKTEWRYAIHWSIGFCNDSVSIFNGPHKKLLNLMAQELRLIPREENYVNPYSRKEKDRANKIKEDLKRKLENKKQSSKSKKNKRKKRKSRKTEL